MKLALPWSKGANEETPSDDETPFAWDDDEGGDGEDDGEGEDEKPADPLASLDEGARKVAEEVAAKARAEERARAAAAAREWGMVYGEDGSLGAVDPGKVAGRLGFSQRQEAAAAPAAKVETPEPEDPMPDIFEDQAGWAAWNQRQTQREIARATAKLQEENEQLRRLASGPYQDSALERARSVVGNGYLAPALEHPDFGEAFERAISTATAEQLRQTPFLVAAVACAAAELDPARAPERARDEKGRFTDSAYQVNRDMAGRGTREAGPPRRDSHREIRIPATEARFLRAVQSEDYGGPISSEEWDALDGNFKTYAEQMKRLQERSKRR